MNKQTSKTIRLGLLVISSALLLIVALYFIGSKKNLFGSNYKLVCLFDNINGLQKGNNVRYSGIDVGTVDEISILNDSSIAVTLLIKESMKDVIKSSCIASIGTDGLMGNKLVNIDPSSVAGTVLIDGDTLRSLPSVNTEEMLRTLELTNQNVALVSANLKNITANIDKSRGTLYTVLTDTVLSQGLKSTIINIEDVSGKLHNIAGDIGELSSKLNNNNGILNTLVSDTVAGEQLSITMSNLYETSKKLQVTASSLDTVLNKINNGKGIAGTLLNDTAASQEIKETITNLNTSLKTLNEDLTGLQHSFLLKRYFRKKNK